ncbi:hypothetical protein SDC9_97436 [bioreactor metagenome]|uniref:Uncharacterized protein n=1 Tax=bioreactor metagenome TaxID=1076179 RepID=A0A645AIL7_9ZZZZ
MLLDDEDQDGRRKNEHRGDGGNLPPLHHVLTDVLGGFHRKHPCLGRSQDQGVEEVVPGSGDGVHTGHDHSRPGQGQGDVQEGVEVGTPVYACRLLDALGNPVEEGDQEPDGIGKQESHIGQDEAFNGVDDPQLCKHDEQGKPDDHRRQNAHDERTVQHRLAAGVVAGDAECGHGAEQLCNDRCKRGNDDGIEHHLGER